MRAGGVAGALGHEVATTAGSAIPASAIDAAKALTVDHIGIAYMGAAFSGNALFAYAEAVGGREEAKLIGSPLCTSAELAAGINGQHCRATNFEESGPGRHLGPLCVHTALAVGQKVRASGRDVLEAVVLGYSLGARFHAAQRDPRAALHHRAVAAAIAARLLRLGPEGTAHALSLAWEMPHRERPAAAPAKTLFERGRVAPLGTPGALASPFFHARAGVQAAVMTAHGFTSVGDEMGRDLAAYDAAVLTRGALALDALLQMELKPWPAARPAHPALQALADIQAEHALDPDAVSSVTLAVPSVATVPHQDDPAPRNYWEAIYSLQWAAAMVLKRIAPGPQWFLPARLDDAASRRLAARVTLQEDAAASEAYVSGRRGAVTGTAEIRADGVLRRRTYALESTPGGQAQPMTAAASRAKFLECAAPSLGAGAAGGLYDQLRRLETAADIGAITDGFGRHR